MVWSLMSKSVSSILENGLKAQICIMKVRNYTFYLALVGFYFYKLVFILSDINLYFTACQEGKVIQILISDIYK